MKGIRISAFIAFITLVGNSAIAQPKLVEKVTRKGSELIIPYEKYVLPNGLTIVVHEDHSDPIVYVDVTYHVGSAREQEGRSGFAHFFEHMMFQGSENVGDDQHFKIVTESGGTLNGTTNTDRTNYFQVVPSNQLETVLWLESDRMGFMLNSVTQQKFEVQRATVKNERGQNYDNRPYGLAGEKISAALYPPAHPYSWLTIGYIEDLNRVDVTDLKKFFLRWYGPNNATLTVSGDVNVAEVIKLAEKYFGSIPRGPEVKAQKLEPVILEKDRYISYEDNIRAPQITFTYPTVASLNEDEPALDVLADVLTGSKSSVFYQNFVKSQVAQSAYAYQSSKELAGEFKIGVQTFPNKTLAQMDSLIRSSLAEFEKRGVTDDDIQKYKAGYESRIINSLASVQGKGGYLASCQVFTGNPNYITKEIELYNRVTKEDVMRVYYKFIKDKPAVILSVVPKNKPELAAKTDNYTIPQRNTNSKEGEEYKNLVYNKAKDSFDRSIKPLAGPAPLVKAPDFWTHNFDNGIKLIGAKNDEVPTVTIQMSIQAGHRYESKDKAGISELLTGIMRESTIRYSAEEIAEKLERLGSSVSVNNDGQDIIFYISSLTKNIDTTLAIAREILLHPKFDQKEFDRLKKQNIESIANQSTQATTIANNVFAKLLYGNGHIMSIPSLGTLETVNSITLEDVKQYYANFSNSGMSAVIVGDITQQTIIDKLDFLKNWPKAKFKQVVEPQLPSFDKTRIYFVNKDKAPQSEVRIGCMALPYDATGDYYKLGIMNYPLGGAFSSRINLNLREDKGFTYGARSDFRGNRFQGPYIASAGVRADATDSSVVEFMKEITNFSTNGITNKELDFTKNSIGQSEALKYETGRQKAGFIKRILDYNLEKNFVDKQNQILHSISKEEIDALAKKYLNENMAILVVGDKATTYEGLTKLGYEVIELDAEGNPVLAEVPLKEELKADPENLNPKLPGKNNRKSSKG